MLEGHSHDVSFGVDYLPFLVRIGWLRTAARLPGNLYVVVGVGLHESEMLSLGLAGRSWHNLLGAIRN